MVTRFKHSVERLRRKISRSDLHWGIISFYVGVLVYLTFLWYFARNFEGQNLAPLVIQVTALISVIGLIAHILIANDYVNNPFDRGGMLLATDDDQNELKSEEDQAQTPPADEQAGLSMIKTISAIILYVLLIPNIGFFSASLIFGSLFIFDRTRNVQKSLLAAVLLVVLFYVLFIEILSNYLLLRVGLIDRFVFENILSR